MTCAKVLCQECATAWEGIWHCTACLAAKRTAKVEKSTTGAWLAVVLVSALFLYLGARTMVWASAILAEVF